MQGLRELEWTLTMAHEILFNRTEFDNREQYLKEIPSVAVTDCKSLFDVMMSKTVSNVQDREAALDTLVCRQIVRRTGTVTRWCPGSMNVADVLTKDEGSASDLWRSCVRSGLLTLASESETLMRRSEEKERRQDLALRRQNQEKAKKGKNATKATEGSELMVKAIYGLNSTPNNWYEVMQMLTECAAHGKCSNEALRILQKLEAPHEEYVLEDAAEDAVFEYIV